MNHHSKKDIMGDGLMSFLQGYLTSGFDVYLFLFLAANIDMKSLKTKLVRWDLWKVHIIRVSIGFLMWCLTNFNLIKFSTPQTRNLMLFQFFAPMPTVTARYAVMFNPELIPTISYTVVMSVLISFLTMLFSALVGTFE